MAFIGTFSRALLESATAVYFGGASVSILDAQGNVILGDDLPEAPTVTSTIADRTYVVGDAAVTVDLRTKFDGATSYAVSPANAAVTIDGYTLTISPAATMTSTTFTVRGINGGGSSDPLTFKLTITAPVPVLLQPLPDQSLLIGGGTVTLPLVEYFSGAAGYAVSPANNGVTISNGNLVISRTTARDVIITVTATNATGQDTSDSFALLVAAPANQAPVASAIPQQNPTANTAFTVDLSSYFVDPEGASLSFDYTGTLPTGITRNGAVFIGTATVTDQTASGVLRARDPGNLEAEAPVTWAVAAQPTLQATITPNPLVAGQSFTITFNATPDEVTSSVTLTGTGNTRSGTAPASGIVTIGAAKADYTAYSATFEVSPALPDLIVTPSSIFAIANVDAASEPETLALASPTAPAEMMGEWQIDFAPLASGPVLLRDPYITGTPVVGQTMTLHLPPPLSLIGGSEPTFDWSWPDGAKGKTYVNRAEDAGVPYDVDVTLSDGNGQRTYTTNAVSVPAAASWWDARAYADIDYLNNRARINGVSYASIAAARTAGAITVNSFGADTVTGIPVGASYSVMASAVMPTDDATNRYAVALDDGNDGNASDNIAFIQQTVGGDANRRAAHNVLVGGTSRVAASPAGVIAPGAVFRAAIRLKAGAYAFSVNGTMVTASTGTGAVPAVTELVVGDRSDGTREWPTAIHRVIYINADLTDAELHALGA